MGDRSKQTLAGFERQLEFSVQHGDGIDLGLCGPRSQQGGPSPSVFRHGHLWLAFGGRLDPCAELDRILGLVRTDRSAMAGVLDQQQEDAMVVAAAYGRFGIECVDRLNGDWTFALWDEHERRLVLARDATGLSSLYWYSQRGQLLFASSIPVLLASGAVPTRPDPRWMAGLLATFVDTRHPTGTAFQDVHALPAGHLLLVQGGKEEIRRWWRPMALTPLWHEDPPQLQERFLKVYKDAVFAALAPGQGKTVATLSGGLDSGSVVALAAPELLQRGQRLTAFVHRPMFDASSDHPDRDTDEWSLALATAQHVGNVDAVSCTTEQPSPIEAIRQWLDMTAVPSHPVGNWFWLLDVARRAALLKADVLLTGQAGNCAVSYVGNGSLWPRVMHLQLARVWAELQAEHAGVFSAISSRLVKPPLRPVWHRVKKRLASPEEAAPWNAYSLIHPGLATDVGLMAAMRADDHDPSFTSMSPANLAKFRLTELGGVDNGGSLWSELGRSHGFVVRDPTRDRSLIELCWRLPDELFWAKGMRRGLVRNSMSSQLPAKVLFSSRRGQQAGDLRQRSQFCGAELLAEAERLSHHPIVRQWIDTKRLMECANLVLDQKAAPSGSSAYWAHHFLRTLAAAEFISRYA